MTIIFVTCKICNKEKDAVKEYYYSYPSKCKECHAEYSRKYAKENSEKTKEWNRKVRAKHRQNMGPAAKIRKNVSRVIARALASNLGGKMKNRVLRI